MVPAGHHTKPLQEGKFSPEMWHPQQGDSEVQMYRDEQTHPLARARVRTRILALAEQHNLARLLPDVQAGEERRFFLPRSGHQLYINHYFVPVTLPGP